MQGVSDGKRNEMSFKQKNEPIYEVSCDRCHLTKVVADKDAAYKLGFRATTITNSGFAAIDPYAFASIVIWMCEKCKTEFDNAIEPYICNVIPRTENENDES